MKRVYLALNVLVCSFVLTSTFAQQQPPNGGFENWQNVGTSTEEPTNWSGMTTGDLCTFCSFGSSQRIFRDGAEVHSGSYSARIESTSAAGTLVNGAMTTGQVNAPSTTPSAGYNKTVRNNGDFNSGFSEAPDSIVFWAKYNITDGSDEARVSVVLHGDYDVRDPNDGGSTPHIVARAVRNFQTGGTGAWERISVPFDYASWPASPSATMYILATFTSSKTPGSGNSSAKLWVDDFSVIYNPPSANFSASAMAICPGETIDFTDMTTSNSGISSWSWDFDDNGATSADQNPNHTFNNPGTYDVVLTAENLGGTNTHTVTVTVHPLPAVSTSPNTSVCLGSSTTISVSGATSYTWDQSLGSGASHTVSPTTPTTYTVTGVDANGCENTDNVMIGIDTQSDPGSATPISVCGSETSINLFDAITGNDPSGTWLDDGSTGALSGNILNPSLLSVGNTYDFTYSFAANGACPSAQTTSQVTVTNVVNAGTANTGNQVCQSNNSYDLFSGISGQTSGGTWGDDDATGALSGNIINPSATTAGTYNFTYTINGGVCGVDSETIQVTIDPLPSIDAGADQSVCEGEQVTLTATGGVTHYWDMIIDGTAFTPASGTTTHTVTGTDANGCSNTDQVDVTATPLPTVSLDPFSMDTICINHAAITLPAGSPSGGTYSGYGVSGSDFDPMTAGIGAKTITYEYTDGNGCTNSATQNVYVDGCAGILENSLINYSIYPNPVQEVLTVSLEKQTEAVINIVDINGNVLYSQELNELETKINVQEWTSGIYFIQVSDKDGSSVNNHKIVIQH